MLPICLGWAGFTLPSNINAKVDIFKKNIYIYERLICDTYTVYMLVQLEIKPDSLNSQCDSSATPL